MQQQTKQSAQPSRCGETVPEPPPAAAQTTVHHRYTTYNGSQQQQTLTWQRASHWHFIGVGVEGTWRCQLCVCVCVGALPTAGCAHIWFGMHADRNGSEEKHAGGVRQALCTLPGVYIQWPRGSLRPRGSEPCAQKDASETPRPGRSTLRQSLHAMAHNTAAGEKTRARELRPGGGPTWGPGGACIHIHVRHASKGGPVGSKHSDCPC